MIVFCVTKRYGQELYSAGDDNALLVWTPPSCAHSGEENQVDELLPIPASTSSDNDDGDAWSSDSSDGETEYVAPPVYHWEESHDRLLLGRRERLDDVDPPEAKRQRVP